ncbi:nucleoside-specific channel-forming protein Tsx [Halotalea alkalilenta]|uniref:nucleoside-specific channel-forming protein Tsx n=1 Tax=Halotalea alkalilenta TaxID=376489 RepID=UPI0009EE4ED4|nr:nucleoside-specific channel-forming protein Tsx [Halotalea alkalilenta]
MKAILVGAGATLAAFAPLPLFAQSDDASGETLSYQATDDSRSPYLSDWLNQAVNVVGSGHTRFGPQKVDDLYLEYEFFGRKGPLDVYGYIDFPKFFGIGNAADSGIWDDGSPMFLEVEPRLSIDEMTGRKLGFGPFNEFYIASNYIFDWGHNSDNRQNTLFLGLGTDIDTGTKLGLSANIYARYQWENYGAENENSWDGYRFKIKYFYPLADLWGGSLNWIGFANYDFGSDLGDESPIRTNNSLAATNILSLGYTHWQFSAVARYWHNGGQWKDGTQLDFGDGPFRVSSNGWGYYLIAGYKF